VPLGLTSAVDEGPQPVAEATQDTNSTERQSKSRMETLACSDGHLLVQRGPLVRAHHNFLKLMPHRSDWLRRFSAVKSEVQQPDRATCRMLRSGVKSDGKVSASLRICA
jgi:hypothetical protein